MGDVALPAVETRWHGVASSAALHRTAFDFVARSAIEAIRDRGEFLLVLAGGETPKAVYQMLGKFEADWSRWQIFFGDERCAPLDDPQRNDRMVNEAWLDHVAIPGRNRHDLSTERGAEAAALEYVQTLLPIGEFDLVLLGLGEDGHTASLFPGNDWGMDASSPDVIVVTNAPKPPPLRVSLSAQRLSRTRQVLFLVDGESKRNAIKLWQKGADIPARAIRPLGGVDVILDADLMS